MISVAQIGLEQSLDQARGVRGNDLARSTAIADSVYTEALRIGDDTLAMDALFLLGWNAQAAGDYHRSIPLLRQVIDEAPASYDPQKLGHAYGRLGRSYLSLGDYNNATPLLLKFDSIIIALPASERNIEPKLLLGELHEHLGDAVQAGAYFRDAYSRAKNTNDTFLKTLALYYLLDFYLIRQRQTGFGEELQEYLTLTQKQLPDGSLHWGHAQMLFLSMPVAERLEFLERTREELKTSPWLMSRYFSSTALVDAYLEKGDDVHALEIAREELDFIKTQSAPAYHLNVLNWLTDIYERLGQYEQAFKFTRMASMLRDSLQAADKARFVDSLEVLHETVQKEILLTQQEEQLRKQRQQRRIILLALGVVIWFGVFAILFFWNRNRLTARLAVQNAELQNQKIYQLEQQNKLLAMSSMIEGQEAERKRIAQDLHDGLGGLLSSVKAQLNLIQHHVEKLESGDLYHKANTLIDNASTELRRISHNMMPSSLSRLGLEAALEDLCASLRADHRLDVDLQIFGLNQRLGETTEIMLYRIIQELCNNVIKHAQASRLLVQINKTQDELFLIVEDNGVGIDTKSLTNSAGIGMKSIESRVKFLNGTMDIGWGSGQGTCITIQFPVSDATGLQAL